MPGLPRAWIARLPHALSLTRALLVAGTYLAAARRDKASFAVLVLAAVLTDILDGPLARAGGTADKFGANVDTAADMMFYLSLPIWVWIFEPTAVTDHLPVVSVFVVLYLIANAVSHWKFGALGVHNRLSRASGTLGVLFALYTILWGFHDGVYLALILLLAADLAQRYGAVLRASGLLGRRAARGS